MKSQPKTHPPPLLAHADQVPAYDPHDVLARPPSHPHHGHTLYTYPQDVDQSTNTTSNTNASSYGKRQPPPPPASAPELPATGIGNGETSGSGSGSGFQVDYTRVSSRGTVRRPRIVLEADGFQKMIILRKGADGKGADNNGVGEIRPPPLEAYIVLRPHRVPKIADLDEKKVSSVGTGKGMGTKGKEKGKEQEKEKGIRKGKGEVGVGWDDGVPGDIPTFDKWSYELEIMQSPTRGRALGLHPLTRGFPPLSAPLIVQLIVRDGSGEIIPPSDAALSRRLVHTVMMVDLVSPDGGESRGVVRVREGGDGGAYYRKNFLGGTFRLSTTFRSRLPSLSYDNGKGKEKVKEKREEKEKEKGKGEGKNVFIFSEMVVRTPGEYALVVRLLDIAGPPHLGTSIGVTRPLAEVLTKPFTVFHSSEFPGSVPVTDKFAKQGDRNLGVNCNGTVGIDSKSGREK
ncbi:hypothetical protein I311_00827 [Cryptococcus gattii NT-10]|nr:hypothetical protein I311_00827 [Cryptococcus gattii NT-10]